MSCSTALCICHSDCRLFYLQISLSWQLDHIILAKYTHSWNECFTLRIQRKWNLNTQSKRYDCRCPKASSYLNMHILEGMSQMVWGGIRSNEKMMNWLSFLTLLLLCERLSVQQTEIKTNLSNMWERQSNKFHRLTTFALSLTFIANDILPGKTKIGLYSILHNLMSKLW